nr:hypothetical protein [Bradyrhizobium sp. OK095]
MGTVIESAGSTNLTQVGSNYYLYSGGTGPELKFQGVPVVADQFPGITPIGGEQTSTGYEVAWKVAATNQYGVWYTDTNGNYLSNIGLVSATSSTLESLETSFHQDLNGDGTIGIPAASPMAASDSAWLHEFFAAPGGTSLTDLQHAAQTGNFQSQPELSVTPDAHDVGAYLTQFLLAQSHADLFGH